MTSRSQPRAIAAEPVADAPAAARSPARTMLFELVSGLRRLIGLHGDALGNAEQAVRNDNRARRHRVRVAEETRVLNDAYPAEAAVFEVEQPPGRR
jgi:hypothetical protein